VNARRHLLTFLALAFTLVLSRRSAADDLAPANAERKTDDLAPANAERKVDERERARRGTEREREDEKQRRQEERDQAAARAFGNHFLRVGARVLYVTGSNPTRAPAVAPDPTGLFPAPTGPASSQGTDYTRVLPSVRFDISAPLMPTLLGSFVGVDGEVELGYAPYERYATKAQDDHFGGTWRLAWGPNVTPLHWGGPLRGGVTFMGQFGWDFDARRWFGSYVFTSGGGRIALAPSRLFDVSASYSYVAFTAGADAEVRQHRVEAATSVGPLSLAFQYRFTALEDVPPSAHQREIGGFLAFAF
jgi:hypothetical protein